MLALQTYSIKAKDESISRTTARLSDKSNSCRCLDAAHGKSPAAIVAVKRRYRIRDGTQKTCIGAAGSGRRRRPTAGLSADIRQNTRRRVAVARSRRKEQSLGGMRRRVRNNGFCTNVVASFFGFFEPCGPQPWPAEARKRAPQAASAPPRQPYFVILSEAKNLFPCEPKAACGLCRARRRETNEVQSRICLRILLYRFFVALLLRMTKREELRVAQRVGTKLFIVRKLRSRLE